jgi:exopolysaccharide biosynthesis protein
VRLYLFATFCAALALSGCAGRAPAHWAADGVAPTPLFGGATYQRLVRGGERPATAHVVTLDLSTIDARFAVTAGDVSGGNEFVAKRTSTVLADQGALLAVNASYFRPFAGGSQGGDDFYPQEGDPVGAEGAVLSDGRLASPVEPGADSRVRAAICFLGRAIEIVDGQQCPDGAAHGIAAGPRLLAGGSVRPYRTFDLLFSAMAHPRTAIGVSEDGKTAWIAVVDGRQPGYSVGASIPEMASLFVALGASDALNLDGGGSSAIVVAADGRPQLLNRPIHTGIPGRERPVATHILLVPR